MSELESSFGGLRDGDRVPVVDPPDLRRVWEFYRFVVAAYPRPAGSVEGAHSAEPTLGFHADLIAEQCNPGANAGAVLFRTGMIGLLLKHRLLAPWQHGTRIDDAVFQVGATFPFVIGQTELAAFVQRLRHESGLTR